MAHRARGIENILIFFQNSSRNPIYTELFNLIPTQDLTSKVNSENSNFSVNRQKNKIIEATGWIVDDKGDLILVAEIPESTQEYSGINSVSCKNFSASPFRGDGVTFSLHLGTL